MATKRMLIDATHLEETRVVVVDGNRLEDLDVESAAKKQLKGNIYLAKVTRVEPSLQAAFVDYGGNRHGFLPFNEIHPDYYQIPIEDREELIAGEEDEAKKDEEEADKAAESDSQESEETVEDLGGDDEEETEYRRSGRPQRHYKIQEVIKRRQILLVQVVKEERGNKGAALTTYISLAGRHCVLMPNTGRGGGISRKITNVKDRRRLKSVLAELLIPKGMAIIVRTAGAQRSKAEIKRDYEYLVRLWNQVRESTLESIAPALVHEEANLIKRSIRDLYSRDIDEIIVEGEEGYRTAKDFIKMLIPSHSKKVQPYREVGMSLFHRYQVEGQLDAMHSATVQLRSGGYIVINPTEALVAIDVNSGRATRERNIEETAYKTNLEAAEEIARQLKLRDLAGLIVIDFIDMEGSRYQSSVERKLKDAMRSDRARIQIGRISPFGLLELSRQRLRPSILETSSDVCPHCEGTGVRRSIDSTALHVLRAIDEEGQRRRHTELKVYVPTSVALYILNQKRVNLADIEARSGAVVELLSDDELIPPAYRMEKFGNQPKTIEAEAVVVVDTDDEEDQQKEVEINKEQEGENGTKRRRGRRRRRGRGRGRDGEEFTAESAVEVEAVSEGASEAPSTSGSTEESSEKTETETEIGETKPESEEENPRKRRRRGRRGGRRRRPSENAEAPVEEQSEGGLTREAAEVEGIEPETAESSDEATAESSEAQGTNTDEAEVTEEKPRPRRGRRPKAVIEDDGEQEKTEAKPRRRRTRKTEEPASEAAATTDAPAEEEQKPKRPRRRSSAKATKPESTEDSPTAQVKVEAAPVEAPSSAPAAQPQPNPEPAEAPTEAVVSVEPFVEKPVTVVKSDGSEEGVAEKTAKRGWWRRKSG